MSKKSRTILFFILAFAFLIVAPVIVLYSEGYRFNFETGEILETGGFFIKTNPGETNISINDKKEYKTSNFSKSILIQNLTPKEYNIKISKIGYQSWEKDLEIFPKRVSEIDIVLFKDSYEKTLNLENILDVYKTEKGFIIKKETGFYFYNLENNKEELITKNINWDSIQILENDILAKKSNKYYLVYSTGTKEFNNISQSNFKKDNLDNIYYTIKDRLYKNNELIKTNIDLYELHNNALYYFKDNYLYKEDAKLSEEFILDINKEYHLLFIGSKVFLNESNESLYILDDNQFKKILDLNNYLEYSEWDNKILFNTGNEIWVYFSKDAYYPEVVKQNTLKLLARFSSPIKNLYFINDKYYIFNKNNELNIAEFDYRDKINMFTIATNLNDAQTFFNYDNKNIYIFENNNLYSINKIIP